MRKTCVTLAALLLPLSGAFAQEAALNDGQIASVLLTVNQADIDSGKLARSKAASKEVKDFAQQMVTDHTASNKSTQDLLKKLNIKQAQSGTSKELKTSANDNMKELRGLKGEEFDRAYIENEISLHQQALDTIDKELMPNAKNAEIKSLVENTRPAIAAHLEHARQIQGFLGAGKSR